MAKSGLGTSPKASSTRPGRTSDSKPPSFAHQKPTPQTKAKPRQDPDPDLLAKGEASQAQFQAIFGANVKAARLKSNLKQAEVAAQTGLTQQYLSLIEAGQQNVTIRTMAILAKVVDHDLLDLLKQALELPSPN